MSTKEEARHLSDAFDLLNRIRSLSPRTSEGWRILSRAMHHVGMRMWTLAAVEEQELARR